MAPPIQENLLSIQPDYFTALPDDDVAWALSRFRDSKRNTQYDEARNYYEGNHRLAFATDKFRQTFGKLFSAFADNLCPAVVNSLSDRLEITSFKTARAEMETVSVDTGVPGVPSYRQVKVKDELGEEAWKIWETNGMDERAGELHDEALTMGDGFIIVWPDEEGYPAIWPQKSDEIVVEYDADTPGVITRAAKAWLTDDMYLRLNLYFPDRIEKYITRKRAPNGWPKAITAFIPYDDGEGNVVPNEWGRVPVFHFRNRNGYSELKDVTPIQDALNKTVADMLVAMEFAAFKQRYVIGMEPDIDPVTNEPSPEYQRKTGVDRFLAIPNEDAKVGQFDATDLGQFTRVAEQFRHEVARVSGTPLHYFLITEGDFPSGEAMKSAEARFVRRIEDRQTSFGKVWGDVMAFALLMVGKITDEDYFKRSEDKFFIETQWRDASPRSEAEIADTAVKKKAVGVSDSQLLHELGYDADTIERMLEEKRSNQLMQQVVAPNPGRPPGEPSLEGRGNGVNPSTKQPTRGGGPNSGQQPRTV